MFKAKYRQKKNEAIDANLKWLLSNPGQDFFWNSHWHFGQTCSSVVSVINLPDPSTTYVQYIPTYRQTNKLCFCSFRQKSLTP